jgi:hypothetical protein
MEELQKIIDWIGEYDKEYECFPHPNLIKMRMKLRVEELQKQVNVTLGGVSKSFTTGCEVEGCNLKVFSLTYCKHHFLTKD